MSATSTSAILLRRINWGEASQLFTFYTRRLGKVEAIGRGTKKTGSKLNGHLQFFASVDLLIARGRNFDQLAGALLEERFFAINADFQQVLLGSLMLELVDQLTKPYQSDGRLFALLYRSLAAVGSAVPLTKQRCAELQQQFTIELLSELGYRPPAAVAASRTSLRRFLNQHLDRELNVKRFITAVSLDGWLPVC